MPEQKAINDATSSVVGTVYQLCVALKKCYDMGPGHKVFIETHGDVTLKDDASKQFEVKHYTGSLTDSGENFWRTLYNWLQDGFQADEYASLVLVTTQSIGAHSRFRAWNSSHRADRLRILDEIFAEASQREMERAKKNEATPVIYKHQAYCLNQARRSRLETVVAKFTIASNEPDILELYEGFKKHETRGILAGKQQDYINALLGFLISPTRILATGGWVVSNEEFTAKTQELTAKYQKETRIFPVDCLRQPKGKIDDLIKDEPLFIKKIKEIQHESEIRNAAREYLYAKETISLDIAKYDMYPDAVLQYQETVETDFRRRHALAILKLSAAIDALAQARIFYGETVIAQPLPFGTFGGGTTIEFRNGIIHLHMQDNSKNLRWRLA